MGGVIRPIWVLMQKTTPNQTGSIPMLTIRGTKIGMVNRVIVIASIKQPRIRRIILIINTTCQADSAEEVFTKCRGGCGHVGTADDIGEE